MARIGRADTAPERVLRRELHRAGLRFGLHRRDLPGRPDIVMPRFRAVIMVHGCFWHRHEGCRYAYLPDTRRTFWTEKFTRNQERDLRQADALAALGWRVLVVWECTLRRKADIPATIARVIEWLRSPHRLGEISAEDGKSATIRPSSSGAKKVVQLNVAGPDAAAGTT